MSAPALPDPTRASATDIMAALAAGRLDAQTLMRAVLDRIDAVNGDVNAIVSLRPRDALLAEAARHDAAPGGGRLAGLPVAVKDLVATKGLRTTYGSPVHANHVPQTDDLVARRLRDAGAIIIGKTNTPEWGHGSHSFNSVFGATRNPYDLTRSAGGSSGGAGAALAARMLPIADGSDMMGSLRNPAAFNNVYGFRPSWGLVPQDAGGETFLSTLSTEGPMARCPRYLALLLSVLAGPNPGVPFARPPEDFTAQIGASLKGKRIGWLGDWGGAYPTEPGILATVEAGLAAFEPLGARVEPVAPPFAASDLWTAWTTLRAGLNANAKRDLYDDPAKRALTKPESLWEIEQGLTLSAAAFFDASRIRSAWYARAAEMFRDYDALVLPSAQVWPFPVDWRWPEQIGATPMDTYHRWMEIVVPVSLAGLPCVGMPAGFGDGGLPMGMQLFGPTGSDAALLGMAHAYHEATDWPGQRPATL